MPTLRPETVAQFRPLAELVPEWWTTGSTTAADGSHLHWTDTGRDGPPVVLLHGVQVDGLSWQRTAQALEGRHRVVMPDLRGHGRSGRVRGTVDATTLVDDVRTVLAAAGVHRPVLVGHSMGADVAGRLAAQEEVRGVVLADPALRPMPPAAFEVDDPPRWMAALFDSLCALGTQPHAERMVTGLDTLPPGGEVDWHEADYVSYVEGQSRFDLGLYRHLDPDAPPLAASPEVIAAIACPILLLTAGPILPGADIDADVAPLTAHWRHGRHVHFADSGHAIPADRFDHFIDVVTGFIDALPADPRRRTLTRRLWMVRTRSRRNR
ncbi:MAG TPA: alpha/beta hydrolase [Euzebyales bacterium]|nr:alpha/beta hydrolase [Euzebyales bacterium]